MKIICTIFWCIICVLQAAFGQGTWVQKANFPGSFPDFSFSFSIGNQGYVGTGRNVATYTKEFWAFDPALNTWTQKADFGGVGRCAAVGFSVGNKGYAGTGYAGGSLKDFWEYDPLTNTWNQKADFGGGLRAVAVGFSIDSMGYIGAGGYGAFTAYPDLWQYNPSTDQWIEKASLPAAGRIDASSFVIGSNAYIVAGADSLGNYLADVWEYNSTTDTWLQKASFPSTPRYDAAALSICGRGYFGTGDDGNHFTDWWMYDPAKNLWVQKANVPGNPRDETGFFLIGNKGYLGLGSDNANDFDFYEYTPDSCSALLPVCNFQSSDTVICEFDCVNFTNLSTGATSWQWAFAGGSPSQSTDQNPYVCYTDSGIYNVTLIAFNGGSSDTLTITNYIHVSASPATPVITQHNDTLFCSTSTSYISYQWYSDSTLVPGATDTFLVITKSGNYNVGVSNSSGCKTSVGTNVVLGIQNYMNDNAVSIWPNPVGDNLQLTISNWQNEKGNLSITIYNVLGEVVQSSSPLLRRGAGGEADVSRLPSGIYFIQLIGEKQRWVGRFVKE